ncbi:MAG: hypothetical protein KatS3mg104_3134 [Phycisphaerae bacterium]|nr:MAG: hypothetical protein KatS3mg104_3134 [Phycisphaerae bacterium]
MTSEFIIGIALLVAYFGTTTLPDLWLILSGTSGSVIMSYGVLTVVGVLLAFGAFGKSAQFPLHTWLADAMVGPTPVSALIHAATMVAAGVFLLARLYPILTPDARLFILIIGGVTILIGSLCALAQRDLKKALAFSNQCTTRIYGVGDRGRQLDGGDVSSSDPRLFQGTFISRCG